MKLFASAILLGCCLTLNTAMAANYTCVNLEQKVEVSVTLLTATSAELEVKSPVQKKLNCVVDDLTNGTEIVKTLMCGEDQTQPPEIFAIHEKSMAAMLELNDQPHYDLTCK